MVERAVTRVARRRFEALGARARDIDMTRGVTHVERRREALAMRGPRVGVRTQTVMNMQRDHTSRAEATHGRVEQHGGVEPAAQCDREK